MKNFKNIVAAGSGSGTDTLTQAADWAGEMPVNFAIHNTSAVALTYAINSITVTVAPGAVSDEIFAKGFDTVAIVGVGSTYNWIVRR